jgi:hypothetical protein
MTSFERPERKKKSRELFSPTLPQEERDLTKALYLSLRRIPDGGHISEDESEEEEGPQEDIDNKEEKSESKEEGTQDGAYNIKWSTVRQQVTVDAFNEEVGSTKSLPSSRTVKHFFGLMFSRKVFGHICKHTNLYAQQRIAIRPDPEWKAVTIPELQAWVGSLIAMGLNKLPAIKMYWESPFQFPLVTGRFTRDRFLSIKKYLHLADNTKLGDQKVPSADRLGKIRPLLDLLVANFRACYKPGRYLTVDEDICKFKGRNKMKQYLRAKIIKWGYKLWKLCDSTTAYVLNLDVYTGKKPEKSLSYRVVMDLMEGYLDKQHTVIMDNYFTSVPLFLDLLERSTYACGTVRSYRKYLPEKCKEEENREPGESNYWQSGNLVATVWQDKRSVRFLSTCCDPEGTDTVTRKRKDHESMLLKCPPVVKIYSKYMGGVDRSDRMVRTYSVSRQSKKWWYRLFYYLLDTALANSYILYTQSPNHDTLSELDYLKKLAVALIRGVVRGEQVQPRPQRKRKREPTPPRLTAGHHWPVLTKKSLLCQQCGRPGSKAPRSKYMCEACEVHLCIDKCFKRYHTQR